MHVDWSFWPENSRQEWFWANTQTENWVIFGLFLDWILTDNVKKIVHVFKMNQRNFGMDKLGLTIYKNGLIKDSLE